MNKGKLTNLLRRLHLFYALDWLRYRLLKFKKRKSNSDFKRKHPDVVLPLDYLMYEAFGIDYKRYYNGGKKMAVWLNEHFKKHIKLEDKHILEWGCGPGRLIRHMPKVIGNGCSFYGTDYNAESISWCKQNLENISFNTNSLEPNLPYDNSSMDLIYGISIFTHLSEAMHWQWFKELHRVLKPNGIMLLSTHGDNFRVKLDPKELKSFDNGELVVRGQVKEGHRTYCAFQPKPFMEGLFKDVEILEHLIQTSSNPSWVPQDIWIIRKPK